jgi:DNA-binding response OmpR family regulator
MSTTPTGGPAPTSRLRVLLVEDNDAASRGLARLLEAWGYDVTVSHDGTSALRSLETAPPPDFVLTDLRLPDIDGREIAQHARRLVPPPRIALITGWDLETEFPDYYESWGIDWVFPKPLDMTSLIARLRESHPQDKG